MSLRIVPTLSFPITPIIPIGPNFPNLPTLPTLPNLSNLSLLSSLLSPFSFLLSPFSSLPRSLFSRKTLSELPVGGVCTESACYAEILLPKMFDYSEIVHTFVF